MSADQQQGEGLKAMEKKTYVYISSWKKKTSDYGLSGYEFDPMTGAMRLVDQAEQDIEFNVTHFDPRRGVLYALEEAADLPGLRGGGGGRVFVFRIDPATGKLERIGCTETWCSNPCYLTLDQSGKYLLVTHHGTKSAVTKIGQDIHGNYYPVVERDDAVVELFSVKEDGTLGRLLDVSRHEGAGPERRQMHAQPHTTVMSPSGTLFAVCDKGCDTVSMYKLDREKGKLIRPAHIYRHTPGTLPRYCVFHPGKPWFYHNTENTTRIGAFTYTQDGLLKEIGAYGVLPEAWEEKEAACEQQGLVIDPAGRYLYDIVRGPNLVTVLEVNQEDGSLKTVQHQTIPGKWPRGCALSPDGRFLLVCCFDSGKVLEYAVGADGHLSETGNECSCTAAAYAIFCVI